MCSRKDRPSTPSASLGIAAVGPLLVYVVFIECGVLYFRSQHDEQGSNKRRNQLAERRLLRKQNRSAHHQGDPMAERTLRMYLHWGQEPIFEETEGRAIFRSTAKPFSSQDPLSLPPLSTKSIARLAITTNTTLRFMSSPGPIKPTPKVHK